MSLASCPKCWNNQCTCGESYKTLTDEQRLNIAAAALGIEVTELRELLTAKPIGYVNSTWSVGINHGIPWSASIYAKPTSDSREPVFLGKPGLVTKSTVYTDEDISELIAVGRCLQDQPNAECKARAQVVGEITKRLNDGLKDRT